MSGAREQQENPIHLLFQCWILDAIGELTAEDRARVAELTPRLRQLFGKGTPWQQGLEKALSINPGLAAEVRALWASSAAEAATAGKLLLPHEFAREVVRQNFG